MQHVLVVMFNNFIRYQMPLFVCVQVLYASEGRVESAVTVLMYFVLESGIMKTFLFFKRIIPRSRNSLVK